MTTAAEPRHDVRIRHVVLFGFTCFTTLAAGAFWETGLSLLEHPGVILSNLQVLLLGIPYAATLMSILVTHEMGHYLAARRHHTPASLPYFIPAPTLFGTFGAIIRMKPPIMHRRALLDIGATGPLAGLVVSVLAVVAGLLLSEVRPLDLQAAGGIRLGDCLLFKGLAILTVGVDPSSVEIYLHPVAFAGWIGLFITSLNLIPVGQLDGGHIVYALFPGYHRALSLFTVPFLFLMGVFYWPGWALWGVVLTILGVKHPPVELPNVELDPARKRVGWIALVVFVLTFTPAPFTGF